MNKTDAWKIAYGLIKVDGLKPTAEFDELVNREKKGEISTSDIIKDLNKKYRMKL